MDNRNSQFDHNIFDSNNHYRTQENGANGTQNTYEYVFSSGGGSNTGSYGQAPMPKKSGGGKRAALLVLTVVLCAAISFAAGFGGAYYAFGILENRTASNVNEAPDKSDLHVSDPEGILNKSESQISPYGSAGEDVFEVSQVAQKVKDAVVVIDATVKTSSSFLAHKPV